VSENNVVAARETFADLDVTVEGTAVGGTRGRTVEFDTATGEIRVITAHEPDPALLRSADD
jgi:chemotaxis receptor (MCP) glutamine deamidase CheD